MRIIYHCATPKLKITSLTNASTTLYIPSTHNFNSPTRKSVVCRIFSLHRPTSHRTLAQLENTFRRHGNSPQTQFTTGHGGLNLQPILMFTTDPAQITTMYPCNSHSHCLLSKLEAAQPLKFLFLLVFNVCSEHYGLNGHRAYPKQQRLILPVPLTSSRSWDTSITRNSRPNLVSKQYRSIVCSQRRCHSGTLKSRKTEEFSVPLPSSFTIFNIYWCKQ